MGYMIWAYYMIWVISYGPYDMAQTKLMKKKSYLLIPISI